MALPTKKRKGKAPTLRTDDFEPYKARIIELHIDQGIPFLKVKDLTQRERYPAVLVETELKFDNTEAKFLNKRRIRILRSRRWR
jgi:hypothetical protein